MKKRTKVILKFWAIFSIVLFLLIPLLSSPVAAAFTSYCSAATTDGPGGNPAVSITAPTTTTFPNTTPRVATFVCNYTMTDNSGNIPFVPSSRHYIELNVQKVSPTIGPLMTVSTGNVVLFSGGSSSGTLTITDTYAAPPTTTIWNVYVYAECEDIPTSRMAWNTVGWFITV